MMKEKTNNGKKTMTVTTSMASEEYMQQARIKEQEIRSKEIIETTQSTTARFIGATICLTMMGTTAIIGAFWGREGYINVATGMVVLMAVGVMLTLWILD